MTRALPTEGRSDVGAFAPIERRRLVDRLAASASYPITLVIAPAGYGKSVTLRQYFRTLPETPVRFSLRSEHGTMLGFLRGFTESLGERAPHAMAALANAFERATGAGNRGAELARWMHAHLESFAGVIAIDDLHIADADDGVAQFLAALVERTKGRVRWILASRSTAGLPVGTWLAYRDADLPIDEPALRFTFQEAREAADRLQLTIGDEELQELLSLTEGWPAAMSFALRSSTRSSELRSISALTREMIYRLLAEQIYAQLDEEERTLLHVAAALPVIDVRVLERAGFDRALPIVERLRERTSFVHEETAGIYQCHDLFREFLRRQTALGGQRSQQSVHQRAAAALEANGDVEHAIAEYVNGAAVPDLVRLLERHGFDLLERARGDIVARAIDALDDKTRRDNAAVLGLQGALQATAGKFARAESLFRRALARAANDRDLVATVSLRLASVLANQGSDVTSLLGVVASDDRQPASRRVEAFSLIAGQRAVAGDKAAAQQALAGVESLMSEIDSDAVRAKVLHHIGIAYHHLRMAKRASEVLSQSHELAADLHLYSIASRASAVLSNLALHEQDDVDRQLQYAESAAKAATKAGDAFALQTALLQLLGARMRQGHVEKSIEIEQRLAGITRGDLAAQYIALFRSQRLAWEGRFGEAHRLISSCWMDLRYDLDRIVCGSQYALFLALDDQPEASARVVKEMLHSIGATPAPGVFRERSIAAVKAFCALAEAINGRPSQASRLLRTIQPDEDAVITLIKEMADTIVSGLRYRTDFAADRLCEAVDALKNLRYADVALTMHAIANAVGHRLTRPSDRGALTATEVEVLALLSQGLTPKEIALRKVRSVYTVRVHIASAIARLGCHGRMEAIRMAQRMGLI